jgi:hypothetical protein
MCTARKPAIQKTIHNRLLPRLDRISRPRLCPDWLFDRSSPQ